MDTQGMTMDVLQTMEEGKINDDKVGGLMELLNSFNMDISAVFRQQGLRSASTWGVGSWVLQSYIFYKVWL